MSGIWFTATKIFGPPLGEEWGKYYDWANLPQLREIISLDSTHHAEALSELVESDWQYNIHRDFLMSYFWDLDYSLQRFAHNRGEINILAVCLEPSFDVRKSFPDRQFEFQGHDLIAGGMSAINNCGGFEQAFQPSDVSDVGLFSSYSFAREVQQRLRQNYPGEPHTDCELWAIWKMISQSERT
jgi:hypothetical protein